MLCQKYQHTYIERIKVAGNAIIQPDGKVLDVLSKYGVVVRITDYRESTDRQKIDGHMKLFAEAGIQVELIDQGQWLDIWRKESEFLKEDDVRKMYESCRYTGSGSIKNGKYYSCCVAGYHADKVALDLNKIEQYSDEYLLDFITRGPWKTGYEFCGKCRGMTNSNTHYIAKGEQL